VRYRHADVAHLAHLLEKHQAAPGRHWIVTDTVFSMVGTLAPLSEIDALAQQFGAWLVVDEAHASGLYGPRRSGLCEALGVRPAVQMGTFSKALGSMGAYVAGSAVCMHWLVQQARGFVFSTAPSPPVVAANRAAVALVQQQPALSEALWRNVAWLHAALAQHFPEGGLPAWGQSPIFCLPMAGNQAALATAAALEADGIFVQAIRPPTVPAACLRVTISATHSGQQLSRLWECLGPRLIGL
jgi:7-keto-8-aminopelargonate synthetase-like enzyme